MWKIKWKNYKIFLIIFYLSLIISKFLHYSLFIRIYHILLLNNYLRFYLFVLNLLLLFSLLLLFLLLLFLRSKQMASILFENILLSLLDHEHAILTTISIILFSHFLSFLRISFLVLSFNMNASISWYYNLNKWTD